MRWIAVAPLHRLPVDRGVAALVDGLPVAVFRLAGNELAAIDHVDPFSGAPVLARGIVGSTGAVPTVASPLHKQRFDLHTGRCLDDPAISVDVHPVRVVDGVVEVGVLASPRSSPFSLPKPRRNGDDRDLGE